MRKSLVYIYLTKKDFNTCTDCFFYQVNKKYGKHDLQREMISTRIDTNIEFIF